MSCLAEGELFWLLEGELCCLSEGESLSLTIVSYINTVKDI